MSLLKMLFDIFKTSREPHFIFKFPLEYLCIAIIRIFFENVLAILNVHYVRNAVIIRTKMKTLIRI